MSDDDEVERLRAELAETRHALAERLKVQAAAAALLGADVPESADGAEP